MFVYSVKGSTLKLAGIICLAAVLMISLLLLVPKNDKMTDTPADAETVLHTEEIAEEVSDEDAAPVSKEEKIRFNKIKTNDDRVNFLAQFGWQVENEPVEEATVKIPREFDDVMNSYNKIQQHQGLDLSKYAGKEVQRYTYKVTNYPNYTGEVTASILVYRNQVIGGDVCSSDVDGFIKDFTFPAEISESSDNTAPESAPSETASPEAPSESTDTATEETAQNP